MIKLRAFLIPEFKSPLCSHRAEKKQERKNKTKNKKQKTKRHRLVNYASKNVNYFRQIISMDLLLLLKVANTN